MRKTLLITLFALLGMTQAVAQEHEYVPLVREGVKWVYYYHNSGELYPPDPNLAVGTVYLTLEFKGDTVIDGKNYKLMHKYYGDAINTVNDTIPICMREEDKVVYGIVPDGKTYYDCPISCFGNSSVGEQIHSGEEFILYDFNHPDTFYQPLVDYLNQYSTNDYMTYLGTDCVEVGEHICKRHIYKGYGDAENVIIEGIGCHGVSCMPLCYFPIFTTGYDIGYWLSHVIEDGQIIYKGERYREPQSNPLPGDYNGDSLVNITDVTTLINILLQGGEWNDVHDMNGDGKLNIADVTDLINLLLTHH